MTLFSRSKARSSHARFNLPCFKNSIPYKITHSSAWLRRPLEGSLHPWTDRSNAVWIDQKFGVQNILTANRNGDEGEPFKWRRYWIDFDTAVLPIILYVLQYVRVISLYRCVYRKRIDLSLTFHIPSFAEIDIFASQAFSVPGKIPRLISWKKPRNENEATW